MKLVNEVQLATDLAQQATIDEILNDDNSPYSSEDDLIEISDEVDGMTVYKEDVQVVFDRWYDYFYESIMQCN